MRNTARSVKQRVHAVMQWAIAKGHRPDNPVDAVDAVLPKNGNAVKHHDALPYADVPDALYRVRTVDAHLAVKLALEFMVLTAARCCSGRPSTMATKGLSSVPPAARCSTTVP